MTVGPHRNEDKYQIDLVTTAGCASAMVQIRMA